MAIHGHDFCFAKAASPSKIAPGDFVERGSNPTVPQPIRRKARCGLILSECLKRPFGSNPQPRIDHGHPWP